MAERRVRIAGTGRALPVRAVTSEDLDRRLGLPVGTVYKKSRVRRRYFVSGESAASLAGDAARGALAEAGVALEDLQAIVGASGTPDQLIPCNAALVAEELELREAGIPTFDINATCLSFLAAVDTISYLVEAGRYDPVLVVSSDIASAGLNWKDIETCSILSDGAAAAVLTRSPRGSSSRIIAARMASYASGAHHCEIRGGGTRWGPPDRWDLRDLAPFQFKMDGRQVFRMAARLLPPFVDDFLEAAQCRRDDIKLVLPHQASPAAIALMRRQLGFREEQFMVIAENYGNMIAASIPLSLDEALRRGRLKRGDRALMLGTSAGFSMGALLFDF